MVDEGTYGMVFLAKDRVTNELAALKKVKMSKDASNRDGFPITALRETNVLLALQHPNIVGVREMVVGKRMDEVFMVKKKMTTCYFTLSLSQLSLPSLFFLSLDITSSFYPGLKVMEFYENDLKVTLKN
jgi:serine/threonine protein kinase